MSVIWGTGPVRVSFVSIPCGFYKGQSSAKRQASGLEKKTQSELKWLVLQACDACSWWVFLHALGGGGGDASPSYVSLSIIKIHMDTKEIPDTIQGVFNCEAKAFQGPFSSCARPLCPSPGLPHPVSEVKLISCVEIRCHLLIHCIVFSFFLFFNSWEDRQW